MASVRTVTTPDGNMSTRPPKATRMDLVIGTLVLRPYVFVFLALFLVAGSVDVGWRRTLVFGAAVWPVAWLAEFASTRVGFPFGLYHYTGLTHGRELHIGNVPFMDSLSFTFLAYASFCLARAALAGRRLPPWAPALVTGLLMTALDVVIDPLAVRGDRWFLGRIFYYPDGGVYFGVPLSNFAGWALVRATSVGLSLAIVGGVSAADVGGGELRDAAAPRRPHALPTGPDARAPLPLQPRVRGLRQNPVSGADPQEAPHGRAVSRRGGRVRRADRVDPRWRATDVPRDRATRARAGRAEEVRLPLHQRAPPQGQARDGRLRAVEVPFVQHPHGRAPRGARRGGLPRRRLRRGGGGDPGGAPAGLPGHDQHHPLRWRQPAPHARVLRCDDGPRRRGHDALAGVQLREGARPGALPPSAARQRAILADPDPSAASLEVQPVATLSPVPHGQTRLRVHAVGEPDLQHLRLAASLLPAPGGVRGDVQGAAGDHAVGALRQEERQRQVPRLYGPLRLRAHGCEPHLRPLARLRRYRPRDGDRAAR